MSPLTHQRETVKNITWHFYDDDDDDFILLGGDAIRQHVSDIARCNERQFSFKDSQTDNGIEVLQKAMLRHRPTYLLFYTNLVYLTITRLMYMLYSLTVNDGASCSVDAKYETHANQ